jgi:hypothetical protein
MDEASKQRRGYSGFHKPATSQTTSTYHHPLPTSYTAPGPPSTVYATKAETAYPVKKAELPKQVKPYANGDHYRAPHLPPTTLQPTDSAYERKKQRAKDARVKLNESIDRLHIAMSVAGTESKKRATHLRDILQECGKSTESSTDHQAFELMESCVKTAESAKKWDRPNFVGSAATLIQCLNSQCEILMKELAELHHSNSSPDRPKRSPPAVGQSAGCVDTNVARDYTSLETGKSSHGSGTSDDSVDALPEKRRRLNGTYDEEKKDTNSTTDEYEAAEVIDESNSITLFVSPDGSPIRLKQPLVDHLASFLDPVSQIQCLNVCKSWREGRSFSKDETWMNLCVKRFGFPRTRQWKERQADDDDEEEEEVAVRPSVYAFMHVPVFLFCLC